MVTQRGNLSGFVIEVATLLIGSSAWQLMTARRKGEKAIIRGGLVMISEFSQCYGDTVEHS